MNKQTGFLLVMVAIGLALTIAIFPVSHEQKYADEEAFTNEGTGETQGAIQGESTITIYDENNQVLSASLLDLLLYQGKTVGPGPCYTCEGTDEAGTPEVYSVSRDYVESSSEISKVEFEIKWLKVRAINVYQDSFEVRMKARVRLSNGDLSAVIEEQTLGKSDFTFTPVNAITWEAYGDSSTIDDNKIDVDASNIGALSVQFPIEFKFYYYVNGRSKIDESKVQSPAILKYVVVKTPSSIGIVEYGLIVLLFGRLEHLERVPCAYE